ncbi:MAG: hypothetical protein HYX90_02920 [Chloroflexi bacterium]|nr:hypothetical protein [Chloroflexota bacterium]
MQTCVEYRVCEGQVRLNDLRQFSSETNPTCFFVGSHLTGQGQGVDPDDLLSFLETFGDTPDKLHVLLFLSRHPRTRCTLECLACSSEGRSRDIRRAVRELSQQGVIVEWREDDVTLYALTNDSDKRGSIQNLGRLTWDQIRLWNEYRVVELTQPQTSS